MSEASEWKAATVTAIRDETPTVKTFTFEMPHIVNHLAGQHYEIRLTAPDGYQAARLYSAASAAQGDKLLELTVALLPDGEVSPYLHRNVRVGDQLELRGPLGKFFVWTPDVSAPALLLAGGSGVVPMRCIIQAHALAQAAAPYHLVYGARTQDEIIYKPDLINHPNVTITLDTAPAGWQGSTGRITLELLQAQINKLPSTPLCYVCGTTPFVEAMANSLIHLGIPAEYIKAERFGATAAPVAGFGATATPAASFGATPGA
ncbi:MAG TPA: ferredoxin reductase [Bacillota bacterium]|nr:ferredoxin reductase [Bacillota bacterium]